jgi:hypothetical protein
MTRSDVIDTSNIVVFGRSLGGAVGVNFVYEKQGDPRIRALIIENTFLSVGELAIKLFPFIKPLRPVVPYLLKSQWDNREKIGKISQPLLMLSAINDQLVPSAHMDRLFVIAEKSEGQGQGQGQGQVQGSGDKKGKNTFVAFSEATHNDIPVMEMEKYHQAWADFFNDNNIKITVATPLTPPMLSPKFYPEK